MSDSDSSDTRRKLDEAIGFVPMRRKIEWPKPTAVFPSRALRYKPGEAPFIPDGPQ